VALYNSNNTIKDHFRETRLFTTRAVFALILTITLMLLLLGRLVNLQILEHESYQVLSDRNRIHIRPITPTRGLIYDRNGVLLAQNLPSFSLDIVPEQIEDMDDTIKQLAELITISEDDIKTFKARLKKTSPSLPPLSTRQPGRSCPGICRPY
jgi:penicillin-binding protein 2